MLRLLAVTAALLAGLAHAADRTPAPDGAYAYFITPGHGETITTKTRVRFGLAGMGVAPAGVDRANTGHHNLLIDMDELPPEDKPMPANDQLIHFDGGRTEALIELSPGTHTLQLVLGDYQHVMHKPVVKSRRITVEVVEPEPEPEDEDKESSLPTLFR